MLDHLFLDLKQYHSLAGILAFTHPDVAYVVNTICLSMHDPRTSHYDALKHILCYIYGTILIMGYIYILLLLCNLSIILMLIEVGVLTLASFYLGILLFFRR